jgi:hypothetical protein
LNENTRYRIIIFAHDKATLDETWKQIPGTNVILIGGYKTADQLRLLFVTQSNPRLLFTKPLSGNTYYKIVDYLQIKKRSYTRIQQSV